MHTNQSMYSLADGAGDHFIEASDFDRVSPQSPVGLVLALQGGRRPASGLTAAPAVGRRCECSSNFKGLVLASSR